MKRAIKEIIDKYWMDFLGAYYLQECKGCPEGHSSFWRTILKSPEWQSWKKYNENMNWDFAECEELGIMSKHHFKEFIKFIRKNLF